MSSAHPPPSDVPQLIQTLSLAGSLFEIQNNLYIGNYQQVVNDASTFKDKGDLAAKAECESLLHRAYIAMGNHFLVIQKIRDSDPVSLQAVKQLALYMQNPAQIDSIADQMNAWLDDLSVSNDSTMRVIAAMIFNRESRFEDALKFIHTPTSLEMMATLVYTYLQMDRIDLADKNFKTMQSQEDGHVLTQLASAWVNLAQGGEGVQRAYFIYVDLSETYGASVVLQNGIAACHMSKGDFEDATAVLQDASSKNPNDADTLINTIVCLQHSNKSQDLAATMMSQMTQLHPNHPWVKNMNRLEESFSRVG